MAPRSNKNVARKKLKQKSVGMWARQNGGRLKRLASYCNVGNSDDLQIFSLKDHNSVYQDFVNSFIVQNRIKRKSVVYKKSVQNCQLLQ